MTNPQYPASADGDLNPHNLPERSVSELASAVKRTIEDSFGRVRVRGEISQPKLAGSGHCYLRLKDDQSVIDAIIWRGAYAKLTLRPEEGLEVIAVGRLTTYPARSSYQLVIESLELAGEGALLKMLEERKRRLTAEGLFAPEKKRPIPFLPRVIGVVTSPTGAVIRDILHRLNDRFPRHVLVWPVLVQGDGAAAQVAAAVNGFNRLPVSGGPVPRPDLLIVARGGGSLEDLMAFNEEAVVRAVAASDIPVISAVGHETDTTLCDFAADLRAPTPTGAAEMAVPVRLDLLAQVRDDAQRLMNAARRMTDDRAMRLEGLVRGLPPLDRLIEDYAQRLDDRAERLNTAALGLIERRGQDVARLGAALRSPREHLTARQGDLRQTVARLRAAMDYVGRDAAQRIAHQASRLRAEPIARDIGRGTADLARLDDRMRGLGARYCEDAFRRLTAASERLAANSHEAVLRKGYALVRDASGNVVSAAKTARPGAQWTVEFADDRIPVVVAGGPAAPQNTDKKGRQGNDKRQESLF